MEHTVPTGECDDRLDIWHATLSGHASRLPHLQSWLNAPERERAARFVRDVDRRCYVIGRGLLRLLLGRYLHVDPALVDIGYAPSGKPRVAGPIHFNLSHSGDRLLFGFTRRAEVGVDIQYMEPDFPWRDLAGNVLSADEMALWRSLSSSDRRKTFFRCWAVKEAMSKAEGTGLGRPFPTFSVLKSMSAISDEAMMGEKSFSISKIPVDHRYAAAWAVRGRVKIAVAEFWGWME